MDVSTYDDRTFVTAMYACEDSEIGVGRATSPATLATPFRVDGYEPCDPYADSCRSVFVSAAWYAERNNVEAARYAVAPEPWMACTDDQPQGCAPKPTTVSLELILTPADAVRFVGDEACGGTETAMCRSV